LFLLIELEPAFPYRDVTIQRGVDANELYEILGEVGRGKFGTVYKCQDKSNNLKLAAKFVPIPKREDRRNVEREVEIMNSLQHHLIIQLYAAYEYQKMMCVVQELCDTLAKDSSSKSYLAIVTFAIVSMSVSPIKGDKPEMLLLGLEIQDIKEAFKYNLLMLLLYIFFPHAVCSPSPCESLATVTDDETAHFSEIVEEEEPPTPINESKEKLFPASSGTATPTPSMQNLNFGYPFGSKVDEFNGSSMNLQQRSLKSYLHTFDRRNSDTNCLLGRRSSGERVNLADEIKKLSDHLLMLAEINNKFSKDVQKQQVEEEKQDKEEKKIKKTKETGAEKKTSTKTPTSKTKDTSNEVKSSKISSHKTSNTATTSSKTVESSMTTTTSTNSSNFFSNLNPGKSRTSTLSWRLQQSIEETPKLNTNSWSNKSTATSSSSTTTKKSSVSTISTQNTKTSNDHKIQEAASIRRAKFRINQMSRDVPIGLPDTHQSVNLEEAANNTKDCLLHLLEKYNDSKTRNPLGRHQSISVDCNVRDNLEYRSMSSINAFFQRHNNNGEMVKQLQAQLKEKTGES
ncbi:serine/threonine-protein kinase 10-A, partial [Lucilia cuprina]|uniref:serine/threonine-protein kinase 10-A n=1 Tax=Lucilia cuprina TaxID=7375 RepID=UPI001F06F49F